jgi:hypothetical protein
MSVCFPDLKLSLGRIAADIAAASEIAIESFVV